MPQVPADPSGEDPVPFLDPRLIGLTEAEALGAAADAPGQSSFVAPLRRLAVLPSSRAQMKSTPPLAGPRLGEVLMVLPRPGGFLFHTKRFYPGGVLRLPTGGIHSGEDVLAAARREALEETGLDLPPLRLLFHLATRVSGKGLRRDFHTLAFLHPWSTAPIDPMDKEEEITEWRTLAWEQIPDAVAELEALAGSWALWGRFRALPHRLLLEVHALHPDWFVGPESGDEDAPCG